MVLHINSNLEKILLITNFIILAQSISLRFPGPKDLSKRDQSYKVGDLIFINADGNNSL